MSNIGNSSPVRFTPDLLRRPILSVASFGAFDPQTPPRGENGCPAFKGAADFFAACIFMLVAAPIIAVLAIVIKIASPGPAFYSQTRLGLRGRPFQIWKLRTMFHNCEAVTGPVWSGKNDRRVTPIGRILRDTHLDELPQLWNVLRGEMSLVGPRPERPEIARRIETEVPGFGLRLRVKPGLTGLAQLWLPPDEEIADVSHKLAQDLFYLRYQGPLLDLRILMSTAFHFIGAGFGCVSKMLLAGSGPAVRHEAIQAEMANYSASRLTISNSISASEPELSGALAELSVAA
jgi:lipopolysaccharide/colanic/teichoic acid biosynthesis glycosyltransferase